MKRICCLILISCILLSCGAAAASTPTITAKSAFVIDYESGSILYYKNEDALLVPASTTKLLTAYLVFEAMEQGLFTEDTLVTPSPYALEVSNNWELTNVLMEEESSYTVRELIGAMLVVSACGVCISLAELVSGSEAAFVAQMNRKLAELGLQGSFADCYGLSDENCISARSLALLSQALIDRFPQVLEYTKQNSIRFGDYWYSCTNCLLPGCSAAYPGADGLKTGSTSAAGKCLVGTAEQDGRRVIAVLMGAAYDSVRAVETVALLDYGFACLKEGLILMPDPEPPLDTAPITPAAPVNDLSEAESAWRLYELGLLRGQGTLANGEPDLALPDNLSRAEAVVLLMRMLGREDEVFTSAAVSPFTDVPDWAEPYIACAWQDRLVVGVSETRFSPDADCDVRSYLTLLYRALGYSEGLEFRWNDALDFAASVGLSAAEGLSSTQALTRGIAARLTYAALSCNLNGRAQTLAAQLVSTGDLSAAVASEQGLPAAEFGIASDAA